MMTPWTCVWFQDCSAPLLFDYHTLHSTSFLPRLLCLSDNLPNPLTCYPAIIRKKKGGKSITFINFSRMTHSFQIYSLFFIPTSHKLGNEERNWNCNFLIKWAGCKNRSPIVTSLMQMVCGATVKLWHLLFSNGFAVFQSLWELCCSSVMCAQYLWSGTIWWIILLLVTKK